MAECALEVGLRFGSSEGLIFLLGFLVGLTDDLVLGDLLECSTNDVHVGRRLPHDLLQVRGII